MHSNPVARIVAVAGLTFREAIRRKVVLSAVLMSAGFLALYAVALHFGEATIWNSGASGLGELMRHEIAAQLVYAGLFPASFLVALTAVFVSAGTISGELDSGVVYGMLARPIRRGEVVLGKALGLAVMLALYAIAMNGAIVGLAAWQVGAPLLRTWPEALALFVLEPMMLVALGLLGSTRLPTLATGVLCVAAYGISFVGGLVEAIGAVLGNATMINIGIVSSLLMPLDALHRKALSVLLPQGLLFQQGGLPGVGGSTVPSAWMVVYAVGYAIALVALATRAFARRDL